MQQDNNIAGKDEGQAPLTCVVDIDTSAAPPAEQFDLYRSWNSNLGDVALLREKFSSFNAHQQVWQLGSLALMSLDYRGTGYRRRWTNKKDPVFDHWILSVPLTVSDNGGPSITGQLHWHCLAAPYEAEGEDDGALALLLPRDFAFSQPFDLTIRPEMAALIVDYLQLLHRSLPNRMERDAEHIAVATTTLLAACLAPSRDHLVEAEGPINGVIMARAKKLIAAQLAKRDLSPEKLCRDLNISRSRLYRIFEASGGISNYIRRQRLLRTRDILSDDTDRRSISLIAEEWGFMDPSTYSRTFRREFGMTPKEARETGWLRINEAPRLSAAHFAGGPPWSSLLASGDIANRS
ncbi:helix-turn-helix domain-containing protein [Rhizobium sp. 16-449-1b]|uniref:helix-turn-helix domain-containing protein n=1 Tax=Rhizobium sp. 16-449-1b TaxID=2819989 RepID=UPI001ADBE507|nr:helix-turn-helix domain-containing protein [Rhizobium sp. 16-449-1b]MBO9196923.1 helix-turn-helix domain-containing protein [Rhizobium sp. 16-449-1b]